MDDINARFKLEELLEAGWTLKDLLDLMKEIEVIANYVEEKEVSTEAKVRQVLKKLGVPTSVNGYQYLVKAVMYYIDDSTVIKNLSANLYVKIADDFKETPKRVDYAIRGAIEKAWQRGNYDLLKELFADAVSEKMGNPSVKCFISVVGEEVKKKRKI